MSELSHFPQGKFVSFEHLRPPQPRDRWWVNVLLLFATVCTTTLAGALMSEGEGFDLRRVLSGLRFSVPLLFILGVHEMGHYFASRFHNIRATLPYFIPAPTLVGTFGAFIRIRERIVDRRALMDIGASGPLAGFIVAIPVLVYGVYTSKFVPTKEVVAGIRLGSSLILKLVVYLIHGSPPPQMELYLSPMAFAAWLGLFVTSLNLLPIGQLDGGHIAYALWGERAYRIYRIVLLGLIPLGFFWLGWLFWALLVMFILGVRHPPLINPDAPLGASRTAVGYICLAIFVLTFTPVPFSM